MNYTEFSAKIKQKYPDYADVDDLTLAHKMIEKYPDYQNQVEFGNEPAPVSDTRTSSQRIMENPSLDTQTKQTTSIFPRAMTSSVEGRGALNTLGAAGLDLLSLPGRELSGVASQITGKDKGFDAFMKRRAQTGGEPGAGVVEQLVTSPANLVMGPAGRLGLGLAGRAIPALANAARTAPLAVRLGRMAAEGAGAGAGADVTQKAERATLGTLGTVPEELAATGLNVGGGAAAGAGLSLVGGGLGLAGAGLGRLSKEAAKRNVDIKLRPGQWGASRGFEAANIVKYGLDGSVRQIAEKSQVVLNELNQRAREIGKNSAETVNLPSLMENARNQFTREKNVHDFDKINEFIDNLQESYQKAFNNPDISLADAMGLRTQIGDKAAFVGARDKMGMVADPDADWKEKVFNKLYDGIKNAIHAKGGPELQAINRAQSEIIPIRQVSLRRLPIAESNYRAGLLDATTTGIGAGIGALTPGSEGDRTRNAIVGGLGLAALRRGVGSKLVTRGLFGLGEKLAPTIARPLKSLNPADYPSGKPWPEKALEGAPPDNFEGLGPTFTKNEIQASRKLSDLQAILPEESEVMSGPRMTPQEHDAYLMRQGEDEIRAGRGRSLENRYAGPAPADAIKSVGNTIKKQIWQEVTDPSERALISGNRIKDKSGNLISLSEQTQGVLDQRAEWMQSTEGQDYLRSIGFPLNETPKDAGDIRQLIQGNYGSKKQGGIGSTLGSMLGNERGAVGAVELLRRKLQRRNP